MKPYDYGEWLIKFNEDGYKYYERITDDTPHQADATILAQGNEIYIGGIRPDISFRESILSAVKSHSYSWYKAKK